MKLKSLILIAMLAISANVFGYTYTAYTPISAVDITSHNTGDIILAGSTINLTCTTSTDYDYCEGNNVVQDAITHAWSAASGTFNPSTGTSVSWTAPSATSGNVTITVTANDSPLYNDAAVTDTVTLTLQNVIYVDANATGSHNGKSWANAFTNIQDAINAANSGNEIWVAEGTYTSESEIDVTEEVSIYGGFNGTETSRSQRDWRTNVTTIDGNNAVRGFYVAEDAAIDGFVISNCVNDPGTNGIGHSNDGGVGMLCGSYIINATISNCIFKDNSANNLGGGAISNYGNLTVTDCIFVDNYTATSGGGILSWENPITVVNSVFIDNDCNSSGGAICLASVVGASITNCTFTENSANYGGAIYNGGYHVGSVIRNCILWGNTATTSGGEIYTLYRAFYPSPMPYVSYCDIEGGINGSKCGGDDSTDGGGNINSDPLFVDVNDLNGYDNIWATTDDGLILDVNSPCIDAGDNSAISESYDIAGTTRKIDGDNNQTVIVDMGSYEFDPNS